MIVTSAKYLTDGRIEAVIDGVTWQIPDEPDNRFRRAVSDWEASGGVIEPAPAEPA